MPEYAIPARTMHPGSIDSAPCHAGKEDWSWRVVAGQNAAYDQFPCQYQIFYRGKARNSMWYDPVFQVSATESASPSRRERCRALYMCKC